MSKNMFQTLMEMNIADGENKTSNVAICNQLISAQKAKGGGHVTIGVPENVVIDIMQDAFSTNRKKIPLLMIIDREEFEKVSKQK